MCISAALGVPEADTPDTIVASLAGIGSDAAGSLLMTTSDDDALCNLCKPEGVMP